MAHYYSHGESAGMGHSCFPEKIWLQAFPSLSFQEGCWNTHPGKTSLKRNLDLCIDLLPFDRQMQFPISFCCNADLNFSSGNKALHLLPQ